MTTPYALLYALRIPWHVIIYHQWAELKVYTLSACFCSNHYLCLVSERINNGLFLVYHCAARYSVCSLVLHEPKPIDIFCFYGIVSTIETHYLVVISIIWQEFKQIFLSPATFGKNQSFSLSAKILNFLKWHIKCFQEFLSLCLISYCTCHLAIPLQFFNLTIKTIGWTVYW